MNGRKRLSACVLLLTFLQHVVCNQHTKSKDYTKSTSVPGYQTAILQNGHVIRLDQLKLLDPYNLIASMKKNGDKLSPFLADILPQRSVDEEIARNELDFSKQKHHKDKQKSSSKKDKEKNVKNQNMNVTFSETNNASQILEDSYFKENDFDLYDDYEDLDPAKKEFDYKTKEERRRAKGKIRNAAHNEMLHEAVRKLLGFSDSHSAFPRNNRLLPDPFGQEKMPRYVKDLYERFQSGEMNAGLAQGNTIRSIHASVGTVEGEAMFLFNLTSLRSSEQLLNAEIHLYKRRSRSRNHKLDIEVKLYSMAPNYLTKAGSVTVGDKSHGWQWYDVTSAVQNCLTPRRHHPDMLALSFRVTKANGKSKSVSLRKFGRHHSLPFLVVYSNETEAVSFEQLDILTDRLWQKNHNVKEGTDKSDTTIKGKRKFASVVQNEDDSKVENLSTYLQQVDGKVARSKRSIYDNEIPEDENREEQPKHKKHSFFSRVPKTHPGILKARKESRIDLKSNPSLFHWSNHRINNHSRRRRRKKHRNKKLYRKTRPAAFPKKWESLPIRNRVLPPTAGKTKPSGDVCGKKKLTVDFADIGWGDWIISPKSFDAHYCSGSCPFPLNKQLRPSNHATIQSIVHAIGIHSNVPAPCCVPDKMSPVTLLYFDEDQNVVLKTYPGMTVDSCACR